MVNVYVLELEGNKYYVGQSDKSNFSLSDFVNDIPWTLKYAPKRVITIFTNNDEVGDEVGVNKHVLKLMNEHGIHNVRGGRYSNLILTSEDRDNIFKLIYDSTGKCYICGESGHKSYKCEYKDFAFVGNSDTESDSGDECDDVCLNLNNETNDCICSDGDNEADVEWL